VNRNYQENSDSSCWSLDIGTIIACVADSVGAWILDKINWVLEQIITLASLALDFAVYSTIVNFKTNFADLGLNPNFTAESSGYTQVGSAVFGYAKDGLIYYIWSMIRDFVNIVIFITIIYHAVQSMFVGFQDTKNKFISLLVFSIVINFSLLFVQIAIDVSNILALQAYTLAVKPTNTSDFYQFRTSSPYPQSFGEYIFNSVSLSRLISAEVGQEIAAAEVEAMESTFFFQLGKFFVYIGIIYIFLFMTGLLFYRAVSFVFAMILAPLITLSVFFSYFGKSSIRMQDFALEINGKIGKYKGDFYEALVKGPLLIFFIYLVGVFAEAIFTKGVVETLSTSLRRMPDVTNSSGAFVGSIGVFFKFVFFLILAQRVLKMINEIDFKGTGRLSSWGSKFANYTLGRGINGVSRIGGGIGRATAKRAFDEEGWATKMMKRNTSRLLSPSTSGISKYLSQKGNESLGRLKGSSFELANSKRGASLGGLIQSATGVKLNVGNIETRGYEKISEDKKAEAAKRRKAYEDAAAMGAALDDKDKEKIEKIKKETYIKTDDGKGGGRGLTIEELEEVIGKLSGKSDSQIDSTGPIKLKNGTELSTAELGIFKRGDKGYSEADLAVTTGHHDQEEKIEKIKNEAKGKVEARVKELRAGGKGETYLSETFDKVIGDKFAGRSTQEDIEHDSQIFTAKKIKEKKDKERLKAKNTATQVRIINTTFRENIEGVDGKGGILNEVNDLFKHEVDGDITLSMDQSNKIKSLRKTVIDFYNNKTAYDTKNIDDFNNKVLPKLNADKQEIVDTLINLYATSSNPLLRAKVKDKKSALRKLGADLAKAEKEYKATLPKEEQKKVEDAKPADKKEGKH
jgi:hypothetical protein